MRTTERWAAIRIYKGFVFSGKYEVSSWGNLRNAETKKPLATYSNGRGQGYLSHGENCRAYTEGRKAV